MRTTLSALVLALALPVVAGAQASDSLSLSGRNSLMLGIGLTGARHSTASPGRTSVHTTGEVASFGFNHWVRPAVAIQISAAVLDADASTVGGRASANAIMPVLFGVSYSPRALALTPSLRPFVSAAAGPYFHTIAEASGAVARKLTESVAGARLALGTNWFVARHLMLTLEGDYHAVGKFDLEDAVSSKPSGFGMSFGFGFSWGGKY